MTTLTEISGKTRGSAFLFEDVLPAQVFTPEDLTEEHLAIGRMIDEFWTSEVEPNLPAIREKQPGAALAVLRKSAELGLTGMTIPEEFGGMEMDLPSLMVAAEHMGRDASYAGWHSAHTGIGTLPIVYFGTAQQKKKYLPRLARMELLAAYALTEPLAGSDALAARTRADLAPDGKHYILNGQKMWITNGGAADLFTIFAKVGGEKFTAFLVERAFPGVTSGAEEHKMGIRGTSTTAVYLDNVAVPVENVLGEIGRGHVIAFNVLNIGRLKLGPASVGAAKNVLAISIKYAKQRKAFGSPIAEFGAIQHKLAEMAIRIFAAESMTWRVAGLIESQMQARAERSQSSITEMQALEEYAAECSMVKVFASEMLDYVVDEGVQIHGGYGFHQDYAVERAYRDSRINRLFEGTNEINRLVIMGMPLKRAARGQLPLFAAAHSVLNQSETPSLSHKKPGVTEPRVTEPRVTEPGVTEPGFTEAGVTEEDRLVRNAKTVALLTLAVAHEKYGAQLEKQQEVIMNLSDIAMEVFAMESSLLRSQKLTSSGKSGSALDICAVSLRDATTRIEGFSRTVLSACSERDRLRQHLATVRGYADYTPVNSIALRREIAARLLSGERYIV
jgi:alkylation response protein AidB-like acyl-CoA dehydrogenase